MTQGGNSIPEDNSSGRGVCDIDQDLRPQSWAVLSSQWYVVLFSEGVRSVCVNMLVH
jgi:hypothetical protein